MDTKKVYADGSIVLQKVPALRDDNCDGCFYKNLMCSEAYSDTRRSDGRLTCTVENYIWEVADATIDEG